MHDDSPPEGATAPASGSSGRSATGASPGRDAGSVLVLQAHLRPGPWVCRSLTRAGYRVIAGSDRSLVGVRMSRDASRCRTIESSSASSTRFIEATARAVRDEGIDVVLPLTESALAILLRDGSDDLVSRVAGPTREQYLQLADKTRLAELAREAGVAALEGVTVTAGHDPRDLPPAPVVVKPMSSVTCVDDRTVYVRPRMATTDAERDAAVRDIVAETGGALVQPCADGARWHVHVWRSPEAAGGIAARILRSWPPRTGMTSASRIDTGGEGLIAPVVSVLDQIGFRGVVSADFIAMPGGRPALHDVNPRLPFSVAEAIRGGVDTPLLAVQIARGIEPDPLRHAPVDGRRYHWMSGELRWIRRRGGAGVGYEVGRALAGRSHVLDPVARGSVLAGAIDLTETALGRLRRH